MKKLLVFGLLVTTLTSLNAQEAQKVIHQHRGFYMSLAAGPVFGKVHDDVTESTGSYTLDMSGTGAVFDFKIGGAVKENLILHATIISNTMAGPTITSSNNSSTKANDNLNVGEAMFGAGVTYYLMPLNMLFSGTLGIGNFSIMDNTNNTNISTQRGFSMQLKVGKEWWVSKKWGLGIGLTYGKTSLTNEPGGGVSEKLNSNRFGILFNASLN